MAAELEVGTRIGDYELIEERERHAAGALFVARYIPYQSRLFLEVVATDGPAGAIDSGELTGCLRAASLIRSPSVCGIIEWFKRGKSVFIASEFAPGSTLRALLEQACDLPHEQAMEVLEACAEAAAAAQGAGIYYLALEPRNLILTSAGPLKLLRAGYHHLLESADDLLRRDALLYRAPEVLSGSPGRVSDVYAMGVLLRSTLPAQDANRLRRLLDAATGPVRGRPGMRVLLEGCIEEGVPPHGDTGASVHRADSTRTPPAAPGPRDPGAPTNMYLRQLLVLALLLAAAFLMARSAGGCRSGSGVPAGIVCGPAVAPSPPARQL
ncbi:MAG: protein kinase domain-containing protein [Candidatus Geothermincolia bacterium]